MKNPSTVLLLCVFITSAVCIMDFIGKGRWKVNNIKQCPDSEKYAIQVHIQRRKITRTQDAYNLSVSIPEEITENSHGVYLDVCKHVDGGCKTQVILEEPSWCMFAKKYAKANFEKMLTMGGRDPDCPVKEGPWLLTDFLFDYAQLPEQGMAGRFEAFMYATKGMMVYSL